jgi:lipopolysaccharide/colanic/teichoic acid biosynthesis glycosyltransferase
MTLYSFSKRSFDLATAALLLVILLPGLLAIAALVRINLGSPVLFSQLRPGFKGQPFRLFKFRTMLENDGSYVEQQSDADRLTRFGAWLRSSSLDELPELYNIVRGEMSFVGPRPLLMEYLPLYSDRQLRRHEVRPGLTGWAQVNGRNALSWPAKFELDVWYVENQGFGLDLRILFMTIMRVVKRTGVNADGEATAPKFRGDPSRHR